MVSKNGWISVLAAAAGGPTLEQCEAIARGELLIVKVSAETKNPGP